MVSSSSVLPISTPTITRVVVPFRTIVVVRGTGYVGVGEGMRRNGVGFVVEGEIREGCGSQKWFQSCSE